MKSKMACNYETIYSKNLSSSSDEKFKLAKIIVGNYNHVYFEIRQTDRGRLTENGIVMSYPVFIRFKNNLQNRVNYKLEYNSRWLSFTMNGRKNMPNRQLIIQQERGPNDIRTVTLDKNEELKLYEILDQIEVQLKTKSIEYNLPIEFDETFFFKETSEDDVSQSQAIMK